MLPDHEHAIIPGRPFRGVHVPERAYQHLRRFHGIEPTIASNRLHRIKASAGLSAVDHVTIGRTGDVYDARTHIWLGSLTDSRWGR